jgi:hypothetical protein
MPLRSFWHDGELYRIKSDAALAMGDKIINERGVRLQRLLDVGTTPLQGSLRNTLVA